MSYKASTIVACCAHVQDKQYPWIYLFPDYGCGNPEHRVWDIGSNEDDNFPIFLVQVAPVLSNLRMNDLLKDSITPLINTHTHTSAIGARSLISSVLLKGE